MLHRSLMLMTALAALVSLATAAKTTSTSTSTTTTTIAPCTTTAWSEWASCNSVDCLAGTESRIREFVNPADNGKSECGDLSQVRCVTGECLEQAYMTIEDGDFLLSVPAGGSMTFIEGDDVWTFADVANTAQSYTTAKFEEVMDVLATYIDKNINDTVAYVDQEITDLGDAAEAYTTNAANRAELNANTYSDNLKNIMMATIASQSTTTAQNIASLSTQVSSSISSTTSMITNDLNTKDAAQTMARNQLSTNVAASVMAVDTKANGIRTDLTTTQGSLTALTNTVNVNVAASIMAAQTATNQVRTDLTNLINSKDSTQTSALNTQSSTLTNAIGAVDTKANGIRTDLTSTQSSLGTLTTNVNNNIAPSLSTTRSDLSTLTANLNPRVGTLETTVNSNLSPRMSTIESQNLNARLGTAEGKITQFMSDIPALQSRATRIELVINCRLSEMAYSLLRGTCMPNNELFYRKWMVDHRSGSTGWVEIPHRSLVFTKVSSTSLLEVTYTDVLGFNNPTGHCTALRWRMIIDNVNYYGREHCSHSDAYPGWRIFVSALNFHLQGVPAGSHAISLQVVLWQTNCGVSESLMGWSDQSVENSVQVREIPTSNFAIVQHMNYFSAYSTGWADLDQRVLSYVKKTSSSDIYVQYTDTLGFHCSGSHDASMGYRLVVDGSVVNGEFRYHCPNYYGWFIMPAGMQFHVPGLAQGTHSFRLQYVRFGAATDLLIAWPNYAVTGLLVEEREPGTRVIAKSLGDRRNGGPRNTWVSVPDRLVSHTKALDNTVIRVSIMDNIGFLGTAHTTACLWRLLVDGNTEATTKYFYTHSSPYYGWRIWPTKQVFWPAVGKGAHTYQLQSYLADGSNECLHGWPGSGATTNWMAVEEIENPLA